MLCHLALDCQVDMVYFLPRLKIAFSRPIIGDSNTSDTMNPIPYDMHTWPRKTYIWNGYRHESKKDRSRNWVWGRI